MRIIWGLLVLATLNFNESYLFAEPLPSVCSSSNVFRIKVPVYPDKPDSPTYDFAFQVRISNYNIAMPWVIVIPGGPGFPSIGSNEGAVPLYYNTIFTDPRGSGCNLLPNDAYFPADAMTTEYLANDILTILKLSNLSNYYVFGHSYGTVEATVLTALVERAGLTPPKGLILEGVFGHYLYSYDDYIKSYNLQWDRIKTYLHPDVLDGLAQGNYQGYTSKQWLAFLANRMAYGDIPNVGPLAAYELNPIASQDPVVVAAARAKLAANMANIVTPYTQSGISVWLGCRELWDTHTSMDFVNATFVRSGSDHCETYGVPLTRPYDAKDYQVTTPICYLVGENDPMTHYLHAVYHYYSQEKAARSFIFFPNGVGHGPLESQLTEIGKANKFWDYAIFAPDRLREGLAQAGLPFYLTQTPATSP
jgi:pimeloyl-ACP methyl ester carboxylesterase